MVEGKANTQLGTCHLGVFDESEEKVQGDADWIC